MLNHILLSMMLIADGDDRPGVKLGETRGEGIWRHFIIVTGVVGLPLPALCIKGNGNGEAHPSFPASLPDLTLFLDFR